MKRSTEELIQQSRLTKKAFCVMDLPVDDRIEYIGSPKWFSYHVANQVLDSMEELLSYPKCEHMPILFLGGETNAGKSSLIRRFLSIHPPFDNPDGGAIQLPVLHINAPKSPSAVSLFHTLLDSLCTPYHASDSLSKLQNLAALVMITVGVKLLIVDDFDRICSGRTRSQGALIRAINNFGVRLQIPIILVGTKDALEETLSEREIAKKIKSVSLDRWQCNHDFERLLKTFEITLPLRKPSNLLSNELKNEIHYMSEGVLGEVSQIIREAAVLALKSGEERITINILRGLEWERPSNR